MTADQQIVMVITAYSVDGTAPLFELRGMLWDLAAELDQAAMFECVQGHRPAYPLAGALDADAGRLTYHIGPVPDQDPDAEPAPGELTMRRRWVATWDDRTIGAIGRLYEMPSLDEAPEYKLPPRLTVDNYIQNPVLLDQIWVCMKATPRHRSVVCEDCGTTPQRTPGPGWRRRGTNPATWRHLCPTCAAVRTPIQR